MFRPNFPLGRLQSPHARSRCSTGRGAAIRSSGTWAGTPSERSSPWRNPESNPIGRALSRFGRLFFSGTTNGVFVFPLTSLWRFCFFPLASLWRFFPLWLPFCDFGMTPNAFPTATSWLKKPTELAWRQINAGTSVKYPGRRSAASLLAWRRLHAGFPQSQLQQSLNSFSEPSSLNHLSPHTLDWLVASVLPTE